MSAASHIGHQALPGQNQFMKRASFSKEPKPRQRFRVFGPMRFLCAHSPGTANTTFVARACPTLKSKQPTDAVIKITSCAICGSDLHIYNGLIPDVHSGDVLGHENMGEVVEVGSEVSNLKVGDRVVVPFVIACGECFFCKRGRVLWL